MSVTGVPQNNLWQPLAGKSRSLKVTHTADTEIAREHSPVVKPAGKVFVPWIVQQFQILAFGGVLGSKKVLLADYLTSCRRHV